MTACLLAAAPGIAVASVEGPGVGGVEYRVAQLVIRQRVMVRVRRPDPPRAPTPLAATAKAVRWVEKKGPKCLPLDGFAGAMILQPDAVDLVAYSGARYRVRLDDDCPSLDFYSGFYFKPTSDGKICADRDALRSRSGRMCGIDAFRRLAARR